MITFLICCFYIIIGVIFVALSDATEDGNVLIIKVILFWPFIALLFIAFAIYWLIFHRD